jgi:hypothetical protein
MMTNSQPSASCIDIYNQHIYLCNYHEALAGECAAFRAEMNKVFRADVNSTVHAGS